MSTLQVIDLGKPRKVAVRQAGRTYTFEINRISQEDWFRYFESIISTSEQKGKGVERTFDSSAGQLELVKSCLLNAEGFGVDTTTIENWKEKIPVAHQFAIASVLTSATESSDDSAVAGLDGLETITLQSLWDANESGEMRLASRLVHKFESPSFDQARRYRRDLSRSKQVGGSRTGKTVWMGAQRTAAALYDELVVAVSGYTFNGAPLSGREEIVNAMDTYHKVAAIDCLLAPAEIARDTEE